ncbi:MAG: DNA polymerase III subunit [Syntrophomonas sp.]|uniref:DNA polymerase III subunit n=1 Tax=Syntrophomonas sp. TaxID=2053627 RepID=UPI002616C2CA|nr:DNA polymerase III subunit [Syntrophomonas sp.]MDD2510547.1 DNA polymerase III subunit [Syntrophomonas sp.]MDD3879033.1 DNA polymerase III subunit [Syntrophomonas sp.]MDD4626368.1 DNA polymerase III subunit [Syntrophomonas sp.]
MDFLSSIVGQDRAASLLQKILETGTISHAYLFLGPAGVGKMSCAQAFAQAIVGQDDSDAQVLFRENIHPDLMVLEKEEGRSVITKEQISQKLEPWLGLKPYRASRRVAIIRDSQLMSNEAGNALLKTLEEPPDYAVIILVADDQNLLPTVVSRCQLVRFNLLADKEIEKILHDQEVEPLKVTQAASLGQGSVATALRFAREEDYEKIWETSRNIIADLSGEEIIEVYKSAEKMELAPELIVNLLISLLRDINIYQQTSKEELLALPGSSELARSIRKVQPQHLTAALDNIMSLRNYYRGNVNTLIINVNIAYEIWQAFNSRY